MRSLTSLVEVRVTRPAGEAAAATEGTRVDAARARRPRSCRPGRCRCRDRPRGSRRRSGGRAPRTGRRSVGTLAEGVGLVRRASPRKTSHADRILNCGGTEMAPDRATGAVIMADASCFHNLKEGGIPRQLGGGIERAGVPRRAPDALGGRRSSRARSRRCTRTPTSSGACASRGSGSASRTASSIPSRRGTSGRRRRTCRTGGAPPTSGRSCSTSFRRRGRSTRRRGPATSRRAGAGGRRGGQRLPVMGIPTREWPPPAPPPARAHPRHFIWPPHASRRVLF